MRRPCKAPLPFVGLLLCLAAGPALPGCKASAGARTRRPEPTQATSAVPEAARLIAALGGQTPGTLATNMSPRLRARVGLDGLERAGHRIREAFGPALGVLEERTHREGALKWYSGLVLHGRSRQAGGDGDLRPVLYQFALDGNGRYTRLVVREHWFQQDLEHPARDYAPITRFHFMSTGEWSVLHGGRTRAVNYHHGSRTQRFAYDLVMRKKGRQRRPGGSRNADYYCYGKPVVAPAPGVIVKAIDGVPENVPGVRGKKGGNGVIIDHGFGEYSELWHGIPGTVRVKVGQRVELGQELFRVGNSGSSTGPHIHFHASTRGSSQPMGLPADFIDVYVNGKWRERAMPIRGDVVKRVSSRRVAGPVRLPRRFLDV